MQVSKKTIKKFQEIYKRKEGEELSDKEALELVTNLILVFEAIYKPIPKRNKARLNSLNIRTAADSQESERSRPLVK